MARIHNRRISSYLQEYLQEQHKDTGIPKNMLIAKFLADSCLDPKIPIKIRIDIAKEIIDRIDGKAVQTSVTADITESPLANIPTHVLEELKKKAEAIKKGV